jgi:predicted  nucleic acid-binding Zn-ribbon protein
MCKSYGETRAPYITLQIHLGVLHTENARLRSKLADKENLERELRAKLLDQQKDAWAARSELAEAREHMQVFVDNHRGNWYATEDDEGDSLKTLGTRMTAFLARSKEKKR